MRLSNPEGKANKLYLCISISFLSNSYEGKEWPPSPTRLFQALVATAHQGKQNLNESETTALEWLENLSPPKIIASEAFQGSRYLQWGLRNNLDEIAKSWTKEKGNHNIPISKLLENLRSRGDRRITDHLVLIHKEGRSPRFLIHNGPHVSYVWSLGQQSTNQEILSAVCKLVNKMFILGRGEDLVTAWCRVVEDIKEIKQEGKTYVFREKINGAYAIPRKGLLKELLESHRTTVQTHRIIYRRIPVPENVIRGEYIRADVKDFLVYRPRDPEYLEKLIDIRCDLTAEISTALKEATRHAGGDGLSFYPLPTIGPHADGRIRRILVTAEIQTLGWFESICSTLKIERPKVFLLEPWGEDSVVKRYIGEAEEWLSVTPVILPVGRAERCTSDRIEESLIEILEQAGYSFDKIKEIWYQRAPLWKGSLHSDAYRYPSEIQEKRKYHMGVRFREKVPGPVLIGLGQEYGMGLFAHP